jgi:hypothetical protein
MEGRLVLEFFEVIDDVGIEGGCLSENTRFRVFSPQ